MLRGRVLCMVSVLVGGRMASVDKRLLYTFVICVYIYQLERCPHCAKSVYGYFTAVCVRTSVDMRSLV